MISRCLFITSSYSRRCLRISKFRVSTRFCAVPMARGASLCSMGSPSPLPPPPLMLRAVLLPGLDPRRLAPLGWRRRGVEPLLRQDLLGEEVRVATQEDV